LGGQTCFKVSRISKQNWKIWNLGGQTCFKLSRISKQNWKIWNLGGQSCFKLSSRCLAADSVVHRHPLFFSTSSAKRAWQAELYFIA